ncbi:hypothetical protein DM82_699 [Burkholderia oklahomensis]|uniref:Uncharacterized protein n=1 Tax=Burkholderia oklahomensis TaxID=342113 RepID=A0AAI8B7Y8_9BURK|nr:hypothetical protein DM82_699 [Burkholderia oklahomensis]
MRNGNDSHMRIVRKTSDEWRAAGGTGKAGGVGGAGGDADAVARRMPA